VVGVALSATLAGLAGCDIGGLGSTGGTSTTPGVSKAKAALTHQPTGTVNLTWNPSDKTLQVQGDVTGLAPNSKHAAHVHSGSCAQPGAAIFGLSDLSADGAGKAAFNQSFPNVSNGIPASGWYFNIHNGTGTDFYEKMDIACADISNANTSTGATQHVMLTLDRGGGPSQAASGNAQLSIAGDVLTVVVTLSGLEPTSTHVAHIHSGSCASQGDVVKPLTNLTADGSGNATATTTIGGVSSIPTSGWYVNVHRGVNLSSPIDFDPIACGAVVAA
jgi:hypothetical protein